jgi:hypothetical protein
MKIDNIKESECSCDNCKKMCTTPCLGTPNDIIKLIKAGYGDKLIGTQWAVGLICGVVNDTVDMIQPIQNENGCIFRTKEGLCELHDKGLKPTEGKLAHHTDKMPNSFKDTLNFKVAMTWVDENGVNNPQEMLLKTFINESV